MEWLDFRSFPLWLNAATFAGAGGIVWASGTRLARYVEEVSARTGIGVAFLGALMLGGITSLPEIATTLTASLLGNAPLAVNNLFGSIALQAAILAAADAAVRGSPLSVASARPVVLLQGALLVLVLGLAVAGITLGEPAGLPFGLWTSAIFLVAVLGFYRIRRYEGRERWRTVEDAGAAAAPGAIRERPAGVEVAGPDALSTRRLALSLVLAALAILGAGVVLAGAGDAVAAQTGLGSGFVGVAFVAAATSLPEVSTTLEAARRGRYDMAFSNIFGTNILNMGLLFVADLAYPGPPVLGEMGDFALLGATLGILLTAVYMAGLVERQNRMVWRLGFDSLAALVLYLAGMAALYSIR